MTRRAAALLLAVPTLAGACARAPQPAPARTARHLVIVTVDTLRADRLGCYGSTTVATPRLDRIASEGALAPDASAHVPLTRPSHVSLFTGLLPAVHGIRDNVSPALDAAVPTLAETLRAAGFRTAAFVSSIVLSRQSGLQRGFDVYSDAFDAGADDARFLNTIQKRGDGPAAEAVAWIEKEAPSGARLFAWLHLYDPHDPYEPPEPYASRYADRPYDGEVAYADELVGRLDDALARAGLRDDTLLVVTSDHGEGLGEHGEEVHGYFVYETTLRVPLILRGPGVAAGTRVPGTAHTIDVLPTVHTVLGLAPPARTDGRDLAPALAGKAAPREAPTYAESLTPLLHYGWSDLRALRDGRFKYILAPRPELYDLRDDPHELRNLAAADGARAQAMRTALLKHIEGETRASATVSVPPDVLEKLGALGYVGGGSNAAPTGADPKDKLEDYKAVNRLVREGLTRLHERDFAGSAQRFRALQARGVDSFEARYYLGRALVGLARWREAAEQFEGALRWQPAYVAAHEALATCRERAGDPESALAALREGQRRSPRDPRLLDAEAGLQRRLGNQAEARRAYEAMLPLAPKDALVRVQLGELYRDAGDPARAAALLREAVALEPATGSYWNALGMVLGGQEALAEAEQAFREAVARDPKSARYRYNLGLALERQGRRDEARAAFGEALAADPAFGPARERLRARPRS
ncbi:MAG: sulfatase-like hydrolase/transferase [Vicinamibacteria bacterium]